MNHNEYETSKECYNALQQLISDCEGTCQKGMNYVYTLEQRIAELETEVTSLQTAIGGIPRLKEHIKHLEERAHYLESERNALRKCRQELEAERDRYRDAEASQAEIVAELWQQIHAKDRRIAELEAKVNVMKDTIIDKCSDMSEPEKQIVDLRGRNRKLASKLTAAVMEVARLAAQVEAMQGKES